jgi:hypothetical protein
MPFLQNRSRTLALSRTSSRSEVRAKAVSVGSSAWFGWVGVWTPDPARQLREHEPALGLGNGSPQFLSRLDPFRDDRLDVR